MAKFIFKRNPQTGLMQTSFGSKLISVSDQINQSSNGTNYKVAIVEFENAQGQIKRVSAAIYESNYSKGVTIGKTYSTIATKADDGQVYLHINHMLDDSIPKFPTSVHFSNIKSEIVLELKAAKFSIKAAIAFFTDNEIFEILISKAREKLIIELVIDENIINQNCGIDFDMINSCGGKLYRMNAGGLAMMHHKFAVIDSSIVITGSFNWTNNSKRNFENIVINKGDVDLVDKFLHEFEVIKKFCSVNYDVLNKSIDVIDVMSHSKHLSIIDEKLIGSIDVRKLNALPLVQTLKGCYWNLGNGVRLNLVSGIHPSKVKGDVYIFSGSSFKLINEDNPTGKWKLLVVK